MDAQGPFSGAAALVAALEHEGIDTVYGTVGHGNLAFVDALLDSMIRYVPVFHEQVAIHAADAHFRASGRIAAVTTTVGPGFTNLATGLGDALLDSSAVLVIAGGVPSEYLGREPLQELSLHMDDGQPELFRHLAKRVTRVARAEDLSRETHRAVRRALFGCPGPVILQVPLDFFSARVDPGSSNFVPVAVDRQLADPASVSEAVEVLLGAERPLFLVGGGSVVSEAGAAIGALARTLGVPVVTTMSGQGAVRGDDPLCLGFTGVVGTAAANAAVRECDVLVAIGTRFPEMDTNSWRPDAFAAFPPARLIHVDIDPMQIDKVFPATVGLTGDARAVVGQIAADLQARSAAPPAAWEAWRSRTAELWEEWEAQCAEVRETPSFPFQPANLLRRLRGALPEDTILVTGVGIRHAVGQHFPVLRERGHIVASGFGTMGQEVAAPIGAKIACPDRPVVAIVGDGAVMACLAALPTAVAEQVHAVWIVCNNDGYASIAIYQSKHFGRHHGTYFRDPDGSPYAPDYAAIAASFGARSVRIEAHGELEAALETALAEPAVWVIEVPVTPRPSISGSGHWDVNDILAATPRRER